MASYTQTPFAFFTSLFFTTIDTAQLRYFDKIKFVK